MNNRTPVSLVRQSVSFSCWRSARKRVNHERTFAFYPRATRLGLPPPPICHLPYTYYMLCSTHNYNSRHRQFACECRAKIAKLFNWNSPWLSLRVGPSAFKLNTAAGFIFLSSEKSTDRNPTLFGMPLFCIHSLTQVCCRLEELYQVTRHERQF